MPQYLLTLIQPTGQVPPPEVLEPVRRHAFAATLTPSGTGPQRAAICTTIGKGDAGERVTVHLQQRLS